MTPGAMFQEITGHTQQVHPHVDKSHRYKKRGCSAASSLSLAHCAAEPLQYSEPFRWLERYDMAKLYKKEARYVLYKKTDVDEAPQMIKATTWRDADTIEAPYINTDTTFLKLEERLIEVENVVPVPCPVGSTLYRIDYMTKACSYHLNTRSNEYACINDIQCPHLFDGKCDEHIEYSLTVIENANAQVILGNEHLFGTRVFTDEAEARRVLEEKRAEEKKRVEQRCAEDMSED